MDEINKLYRVIRKVARSDHFLHLGELDHMNLIYPLQRLGSEDWIKLTDGISSWSQIELQVLAEALLTIKDNKKANFDTGALFGQLFILSDDLNAASMLDDFDFIQNDIPKKGELVDGLLARIKNLEGKTMVHRELTHVYDLVNQLYNNVV